LPDPKQARLRRDLKEERSRDCLRGARSRRATLSVCRCGLHRPNPAAGRELARMRRDTTGRFAMEVVCAIGVNLPHPEPAIHGELPFSNGIGIDVVGTSGKGSHTFNPFHPLWEAHQSGASRSCAPHLPALRPQAKLYRARRRGRREARQRRPLQWIIADGHESERRTPVAGRAGARPRFRSMRDARRQGTCA
jgi:hypothetical protein